MERRDGIPANRGLIWTAALAVILSCGGILEEAAAQGGPGEDRALREARGRVAEVQVSRDAAGVEWVEAVVDSDAGERLDLRLAPPAILEKAGFVLKAGDAVRVRFFTEPVPYPVQKIRNETSHRDLRLRCLHGEPLWDSPGHGPGEGGRRYRGGRGDEWRGGKRRGGP